MASQGSSPSVFRPTLFETETRLDELGHARDTDIGSESTMTDLAAQTAAGHHARTLPGEQTLSFILSFAQPVTTTCANASSAAMMTETFERGGSGARDNDADASGTETKVGDPTARDNDVDLGGYAPIGTRRSV